MTRCSNCFFAVGSSADMARSPWSKPRRRRNGRGWPNLREFGFAVAHEPDQSSVARIAGGNQRAMRRLRFIVFQRPADKFGERAAGFVHQKIGRRKVPIMTAA